MALDAKKDTGKNKKATRKRLREKDKAASTNRAFALSTQSVPLIAPKPDEAKGRLLTPSFEDWSRHFEGATRNK